MAIYCAYGGGIGEEGKAKINEARRNVSHFGANFLPYPGSNFHLQI